MRIIYLVRQAPFPNNAGIKFRINGIWQALRDLGDVQLVVISDTPPYQIRRELYQSGTWIYPSRRETGGWRRLAHRLCVMLRGGAVPSARYFSRLRAERLAARLSAAKPDLVVIDDTFLAVFAPYLKEVAPKLIIDTHNVESVLMTRIARETKNIAQKLQGWVEARYMEKMERGALPLADQVWAVSENDAEHYRERVRLPDVRVIPNVIDISKYTPRDDADEATIVFMGWFYHWPNIDAALRLMDYSRQLLTRGVKHRLVLVGRSPSAEMLERASRLDHVEVTGEVADITPFVERATIFAAPLAAGAGTKLKILEAMALARPVVTTPIGAEGLQFESGRHGIVADSDEAFIDALAALLADPDRAASIGRAGRQFVEAHFTLETVKNAVAEALDDMYGGGSPLRSPAT